MENKKIVLSIAVGCLMLLSNLLKAAPVSSFPISVQPNTGNISTIAACPVAMTHYSQISSQLSSENTFCSEYLQAKSERERYQSATFNIMNICMKMEDWIHHPECQTHYDYIWDLIQNFKDAAQQKMDATSATCTPHLGTINSLTLQLEDAKKQVCNSCNKSPDSTPCFPDIGDIKN